MTDERNLIENSNDQPIDFSGLFLKFLFYWRWFLMSITLCCIAAFIFIRFQTPIYEVSSSVMIKEENKKDAVASSPLAAIQDLGMFSMTSNFDNEIEILKSRSLIKKVVSDLELYVNVVSPRTFGYAMPMYKNSPLHIYMSPQEAEILQGSMKLELDYRKDKLLVEATYFHKNKENTLKQEFVNLPAVLPTPVGVVTISSRDTIQEFKDPIHLTATINSLTSTAMAYVASLIVAPTSKTTTIANIRVLNAIQDRGVDFINCLISNYNRDTNDEKNEVAQKTAEFIQQRISLINTELGNTESRLANFKQKSGLTDLTSDAQMALQESSKYEQQRTENATQIRLVQYLDEYVNDPKNKNEVLPANVGLQDAHLSSVIEQYNTMIIERKRLMRTSSENNPAVMHMNIGIKAMRNNVRTTVASVLKGLEIAKTNIEQQAFKFESRISNAPKQEKEYINISRQQEIQAALYIMLLQKREENAITLAATANNGRIIEEPMATLSPVAPRSLIILISAFLLGLAIPIVIIYIYDLTRYKIETREDVENITRLPIIGELPLSTGKGIEGEIMLRENRNELVEETFRSFRTNLLFMLNKNQKVILLTSTMPGEGKSFVAGNIATSLAYLGKKVLVIGLDIRKPGLNKVFNLNKHVKGITDYLVDSENIDLRSLIQHSEISSNLDVLVGGTIPPNPTELVARDILEKTINELKEHYDYLILDSAPIAIVTDTSIISRVADLCVYVCRADVTPKSDFSYVNELYKNKRFDKLAIVLNGLDLSQRKYGYTKYGYGKYGYGKYGYAKYGYNSVESK